MLGRARRGGGFLDATARLLPPLRRSYQSWGERVLPVAVQEPFTCREWVDLHSGADPEPQPLTRALTLTLPLTLPLTLTLALTLTLSRRVLWLGALAAPRPLPTRQSVLPCDPLLGRTHAAAAATWPAVEDLDSLCRAHGAMHTPCTPVPRAPKSLPPNPLQGGRVPARAARHGRRHAERRRAQQGGDGLPARSRHRARLLRQRVRLRLTEYLAM